VRKPALPERGWIFNANQPADKKVPRGYRKATREANKAGRVWTRLKKSLGNTRATTFEGMIAKMRCARAYEGWAYEDIQDGPPHQMALSIMDDLQALARTAHETPAPIAPDA